MEDVYAYGCLHPTVNYSDRALMPPENLFAPSDYQNLLPEFRSEELLSETASVTPGIQEDEEILSAIKARIASHPRYPTLLQAYIDCQKIGAPPDIACFLNDFRLENHFSQSDGASSFLGTDPELDDFMETYCDILVKYKSDLARPFDEATTFLNQIQLQLCNLCNGVSAKSVSDDGAVSSDDEHSGGETDIQEVQPNGESRGLKDTLLRKFGGHISTLKREFSKTKKKTKLPKEARQTLLEWWNLHYKWPYPTDSDKVTLAEMTALDQKQINNWFINQRKRHWKPTESMHFAVLENLSGKVYQDD